MPKTKSIKELAKKRLSSGPGALSSAEQRRLISAGGGGFNRSTVKKTKQLAKGPRKRKGRS